MLFQPGAAARRSFPPDVRPREVWAWAMYDFANSGFTTVVITAVFNAYFVAVVAGNAVWATFAWSAALAVSYGLILVTAPRWGPTPMPGPPRKDSWRSPPWAAWRGPGAWPWPARATWPGRWRS
jgi:hypothetical protein